MADNPLRKKIGPLEVWQYVTIGTAGGLMYWLYKKKKSESGVSPEEEEKLLGALSRAGGGGGEGSSTGTVGGNLPVPGLEGPVGTPGPQGPAGEAPARTLEAQVENLERLTRSLQSEVSKNQPPAKSHTSAPHGLPKGYVRNQKGEAYRTVIKGNGIFHEYKNRKGPSKIVRVGMVHKPKPKPKRTKRPKPIAHKVTAKKVPVRKSKRKPVHR